MLRDTYSRMTVVLSCRSGGRASGASPHGVCLRLVAVRPWGRAPPFFSGRTFLVIPGRPVPAAIFPGLSFPFNSFHPAVRHSLAPHWGAPEVYTPDSDMQVG